MAGGNKPNQGRAGEAKFHTVPWAAQGDLGSKVLKKGDATANYTAGSTVEMSWAIRYNHGGGCELMFFCLQNIHLIAETHVICSSAPRSSASTTDESAPVRLTDQYRLCPASEPLTEECFQKLPLKFGGPPKLRHVDGTETEFRPTYVTEGTTPPGSTWAMNPIPVCLAT